MALSATPHPAPPPHAGGHLPPLAWIVVAGLLVVAVFAYSSWYPDWSGASSDGAAVTGAAPPG